MYQLELQHVSHVYGSGTPFKTEALKDVSIGFEKGKITGLIGHTGSGKSTLVQMLNGLIKPDEGKVLLDGIDIWSKPKEMKQVRFRVGLVMQYPEYQLFEETVRKDIGYALTNLGLEQNEIEKRVLEAAQFVGIPKERLDDSPFDLSGGQKRRVAIAGILAMKPEVLVLDEPAAGLDPLGRKEILGGLLHYQKETGTTIIIVSHSMEDMAVYCDQLVVLNQGQVLLSGEKKEVFSHAKELVDCGLDIPSIAHIGELLIKKGIPLQGELFTVDGMEKALLEYLGGAK